MAERKLALKVTMLPKDTNAHGTIFGGIILSYIDLAGSVTAREYAAKDFVTRAMREVGFIAPVYVGDVVSFYTEVVKEGRTSLTVCVDVEAERYRDPSKKVTVTKAEVVYVAIDDSGKTTPLR